MLYMHYLIWVFQLEIGVFVLLSQKYAKNLEIVLQTLKKTGYSFLSTQIVSP